MAEKDQVDTKKGFSFDKNSKEAEGCFINENGIKIVCKYWSKELVSPRALVFMCHGAAEHVGPYTELANLLTEQNFFVFGHDHQGHGKSGGTRMHIDDFRHYSRDVFVHIDRIKLDFPGLPVFIIGHSMGGAVTIQSGLDRPDYFQGVVLIGPVAIPEQDKIGPVQVFFAKIISRILPQFPILKLDDSGISRDSKVVEAYKKDELNYHGSMKAKWGYSLLLALQEMEPKLETIEWPFLCIHGEKDSFVSVNNGKVLYEKARSKDKTLTIYPEAFHQLHKEIEPDKTRACKEIIDWLVNHTL